MVQQYLDHSRLILAADRPGYNVDFKGGSKEIGLISLFGYQNRYDLNKGFPLVTTKKMPFKSVAHELIWFLRGDTNIKYLVDNKVPIWNDNAFDHNLKRMVREGIFSERVLERYSDAWKKARDEYVQRVKESVDFSNRWGNVGRLYGSQWRDWAYIDSDGNPQRLDQLGDLVEKLSKKPTSKRTVVTAWNPGDNLSVSQPSCHILFQVNGNEQGQMDLQLYQRSCDMFLGVPFNIASYAMLTMILAQQAGLQPRNFVHTFGDSHLYAGDGERGKWYGTNLDLLQQRVRETHTPSDYKKVLDWLHEVQPQERPETKGMDHVTGIVEQLSREPKPLPRLTIARKPFDKLTIDDFVLEGYDYHPTINRTMAI